MNVGKRKINSWHVNKQSTNHSSATEREIAEEQRWFLSSNSADRLVQKVGQLAMSDSKVFVQCCATELFNFVACLTRP